MQESGPTLSESHYDDRPDEIIEYRWDRIIGAILILVLLPAAMVGGSYLNGQRMARVTMRPRSDRTTASSSKFRVR